MREQSGLPYTLRYINERAPFIDFNDNQIETKQNKRLSSACWKRNINYSRPITANDSWWEIVVGSVCGDMEKFHECMYIGIASMLIATLRYLHVYRTRTRIAHFTNEPLDGQFDGRIGSQ